MYQQQQQQQQKLFQMKEKVDFQPSLTCADMNAPALHTYSCIYAYILIHK